jgi:hypothetical protein
MLYFEPHGTSQAQESTEQVCIKVDLVFYEPLMSANYSSSQQKSNKPNGSSNSNLFGKCFDNISIQFNHNLVVELDISIIDRMYYLLNDISKCSCTPNPSFRPPNSSSHHNATNNQTQLPVSIKNIEIKCTQLLKVALRFPIADLRQNKAASTVVNPSSNSANSKTGGGSTLNAAATAAAHSNAMLPTMIAFKRLRPQVLTLHIFDFAFHTVIDNLTSSMTSPVEVNSTLLTFTTAQCNLYYQYTKKDRPIHFGLIQENNGEDPQSKKQPILFSIKIPNNLEGTTTSQQGLGIGGSEIGGHRSNVLILGAGLSPEQDSLGRQILNRANTFYYGGGSIKEEQLKEHINLGMFIQRICEN